MPELKLGQKVKNNLDAFIQGLQGLYKDSLISVILYGSGSSGEFIDKNSNLNVLVILRSAGLEDLKIASRLVNKWRFRAIRPLFFDQDYVRSSNDVFPIEFLDMKENYTVLAGSDVLKDVTVETKNLRFQCEQELKIKLINLKQAYLRINRSGSLALGDLLFRQFTSVLHILRNVLRLKGKKPPYLKQDIIKEAALDFGIDLNDWQRILALKNKQAKSSAKEIEQLFVKFVIDLGRIASFVDKL